METLDSLKPSLKHLTDGSMTKPTAKQYEPLQEMSRAHIDSFNSVMDEYNLKCMITDIQKVHAYLGGEKTKKVTVQYMDAYVSPPEVCYGKKSEQISSGKPLFPKECRLSNTSYVGKLTVKVGWYYNDVLQLSMNRMLGNIPIMVKSKLCNLQGLPPKKLVARGEELEEFGGYFIVNGYERIARLLIQQRRNMPIAIKRATWAMKKKNFTEYGVSMRCVHSCDYRISTHVAHYLATGEVELSLRIGPQMFYLPIMLVLVALTDNTPEGITNLLAPDGEDYIAINARNMLSNLCTKNKVITRAQAINFLGNHFRIKLPGETNEEVARNLIQRYICIHVETDIDKFNALVEMTRKLFKFANNECCAENPDWLSFQEVLTPGCLYQLILRESLSNWLNRLRIRLELPGSQVLNIFTAEQAADYLNKVFPRVEDITNEMRRWISTGNIKTDLGLTQTSGLTVLADKLNYLRYCSHFRSVHRGSYFMDIKSTEVRKLRPETWGFLCPTHTPDGGPCGLLVHMSAICKVATSFTLTTSIEKKLCSLGVERYREVESRSQHHLVLLDGKVIGWAPDSDICNIVDELRRCKIHDEKFPKDMEICLVPKRKVAAQYPGLFIYTKPGRLIRPVKNRKYDEIEWIGTMEQLYLRIAVDPKEVEQDDSIQYIEITKLGIMSELAAMTPFSDHNQSCRNMYQCQMAKQTMGIPLHAWNYRTDDKLYRLTSPQAPLVKTPMYDYMKGDNYPLGTNAVVAVMSYTGFDMEDAIAINKNSYERGFAFGTIVKTKVINLKEIGHNKSSKVNFVFDNKNNKTCTDPKVNEKIDIDGFPFVGISLEMNDPMCSYFDLNSGKYTIIKYEGQERAIVQQVIATYNEEDSPSGPCQKAIIVLCISRKPVIGDKFSSRHGQKGVCSVFYPGEDMPFTLTGMTPDIIFNPHGFPSRMTIGMMVELMAGKSAAELGICHNAAPFIYANGDEEEDDEVDGKTAVEVFQEYLVKAGFNYNGTDILIGGTNGRPLTTYIFTGIVYYQRLRHMVLDKWQVRMSGKIDSATLQPVGGRKRGGGVRFGEMERDALIAHGASMILHDRLFTCSDGMIMQACKKCGSLISPIYEQPSPDSVHQSPHWRCLTCGKEDTIVHIAAPYIFRYFVSQLASINIKTVLKIGQT